MTRKISIRSYRKPDTLYSPLDLVVCEGETEVDYLCELARSWRIHVHICKGDGTDPKSIVSTAKRKSKGDGVKYDKIFCVFDRDNDLSALKGNPVNLSKIDDILKDSFYYGVMNTKDGPYPHRHEPLISHELFENVCNR